MIGHQDLAIERDHFTIRQEIVIRPCMLDDLRQLEWFGLFREHRDIFENAFRRQQAGDNLMLVADLRGHPVGQVWIDLALGRDEGVGRIWALRVFPYFQGSGIGSRLMRAAERELAQRGFAIAEIGVEKENDDARRLYERRGYRVVREVREDFTYRRPDGSEQFISVDQWFLQKVL